MFEKPVIISKPSVVFAENKISNQEILDKVSDNFEGKDTELKKVLQGIKMVFRYCDSNTRYLGTAPDKKPVDYIVEAVHKNLEENKLKPSDIDTVIYAGIYREYFEPAVAMEVAGKTGIKKAHAFDVTSACAGMLQSVFVAGSLMQTDPSINNVLCCALDFPDICIDYNIQNFEELATKSAGLTLGSGAAAWVLSRDILNEAGAKLKAAVNFSLPESYDICQTPVNGKFISHNKELFELGRTHVPGVIQDTVSKAGWDLKDVDHFISHQPGKKIIKEIYKKLNVSMKKAPVTHHLYGNTVNITIPMTLDYLLQNQGIAKGDKIIMTSVAAGFTTVSLAAEWVSNV
ncbi:MAG: hypothetical protein C0594_10750 [Marinilabiliales bacterium]|nr:MAG: hypothetical protein C0594_10750 [Marinilabiliales bacterium]